MARRIRSCPVFKPTFFFLLLLFIYSMFPCKHCQEGFTALSSKGLKLHQKKCLPYLSHEAAANSRRKATVESKKVRQTKLKERKARLDLVVPGVSFL